MGAQPNCCGVTWSGDKQLFFTGLAIGDQVTVTVQIPADGTWRFATVRTTSLDYANTVFTIDGNQVGGTFLGFTPTVQKTEFLDVGTVRLAKGPHQVTLLVVGKTQGTNCYFAGWTDPVHRGRGAGRGAMSGRQKALLGLLAVLLVALFVVAVGVGGTTGVIRGPGTGWSTGWVRWAASVPRWIRPRSAPTAPTSPAGWSSPAVACCGSPTRAGCAPWCCAARHGSRSSRRRPATPTSPSATRSSRRSDGTGAVAKVAVDQATEVGL